MMNRSLASGIQRRMGAIRCARQKANGVTELGLGLGFDQRKQAVIDPPVEKVDLLPPDPQRGVAGAM
jgi:hypothetical protein